MKLSDVRNQPVVSVADAEKLGTVEDIVLDPSSGKVLGLRVRRAGLFTKGEAVLLDDVLSIGLDAVTLQDASRMNDEKKFREFDDSTTGSKVIGARMMTEHGHEVGTVSDLDVDFEHGVVTQYLLSGSFLDKFRKDEHSVPASAVLKIGDSMVVVNNDVAPT